MSVSLRYFRNTALALAYSAVLVAPWLFGGAEPWAYFLLALLAGGGMWFCLLGYVCDPGRRVHAGGLMVAALLVTGWGLLQGLCLPVAWSRVQAAAIEAVRLDAGTWLSALDLADMQLPASLGVACTGWSVAPVATRHGLIILGTCVCVLIVMLQSVRTWRQVVWMVSGLTMSGCLLVLVAVLHRASRSGLLLWFHQPLIWGDILGPFTNRNHFALYVNLVLSLALGMAVVQILLAKCRSSAAMEDVTGLRFVMDYARDVPLRCLAVAFLVAGVFFSLSRAAMVSLAIMAIPAFILTRKGCAGDRGTVRRIGVMLGLLCLVMILWLGVKPIAARLATLLYLGDSPIELGRFVIWPDLVGMWRDVWCTGTGWGTFQYVFPMYQHHGVAAGRWTYAHMEILHLAVEGGWVGLVTVLGLLVVSVRMLRRTIQAPETRVRVMGAGVAMGLGIVFLHSLVDYGIRKPANALLATFLLGLGFSVFKLSRHYIPPPVIGAGDAGEGVAARLPRRSILAVVLLAGWSMVMMVQVNRFLDTLCFVKFTYQEKVLNRVNDPATYAVVLQQLVRTGRNTTERALLPEQHRYIASRCIRMALQPNLAATRRMECAELAVQHGLLTVRAAPTDYLSWVWVGRALAVMGAWDEADTSLQMARRLAPPGARVFLLGETANP